MAAHADGRWIAGVGWVAASHPYARGAARLPKPRRRRGGMGFMPSRGIVRVVFGLAGSAAAGLVAFSAFGWHSWISDLVHSRHDVATPASIGGDPLVLSGPLAGLSNEVNTYMANSSLVEKSAGGFYARPGATSPSYAAFGIQHRGASLTQSDMNDIVIHIAGGSFQGSQRSETRDGVTYTCGNVKVPVKLGTACVWDDYNVAGFLVSFESTDLTSGLTLTQMARNAMEGTTSAPPSPSSSSAAS